MVYEYVSLVSVLCVKNNRKIIGWLAAGGVIQGEGW